MSLRVSSPAFPPHGRLPVRHARDGGDVSPPLRWTGVPDGTRELALLVEGADAAGAVHVVHWLVYGIPGRSTGLPAGVPKRAEPGTLAGVAQGRNHLGDVGYAGPFPAAGGGVHRYRFLLFALGEALVAPPGLDGAGLVAAMADRVLDCDALIGTYERHRRTGVRWSPRAGEARWPPLACSPLAPHPRVEV